MALIGPISCPTSCGRGGYCDTSVGRCICEVGRSGVDCSQLHFGPCRLHEAGEMACMTFVGLMSCECRTACERRMGGVARRHPPLCWDWANESVRPKGITANLSDFPATTDSVVFRTPTWPPMGRCAKPDPPQRCAQGMKRSLRRATNMLGGSPLPNARCPSACSHRGTCLMPLGERKEGSVERFPLSGPRPRDALIAPAPACVCHAGYSGAGCEIVDMGFCFNSCSGHGACVARFCLCERGWRGLDCSLAQPPSAAAQSDAPARKYAPMYVYPLPTDYSLEAVYQRDQLRSGQYYANLKFAAQLHSRRDSIVADPEEAALFFVPVMVMQMAGNLWHPYQFLRETQRKLQHEYPFWNRSAGADHVFFLTTDRSGCWKPWALQHSIIIGYLGFRASEGYFGFEERLMWPRKGPNRHNNAYSLKTGNEALELDCYVPGKDVVVPVDASLGAAEEAKLPRPGTEASFRCLTTYKVLLFMGGSMSNMGRVEYSQGVRQAIQQLHRNETQFVLGGKFTLGDLRASRFCLAPSGWGWGWRLSLAIVTQCVPVIIQPNVTQPFEDLLEGTPYAYSTFALMLTKADIPRLPAILRAVPQSKLCEIQRQLARVHRAFLWQRPHGPEHANAYDLTQILLCRRAKALAAKFANAQVHQHAYLARHPVQCADSLEAAGIRF